MSTKGSKTEAPARSSAATSAGSTRARCCAEKPSLACLSSRVPYGTAIDRELLGKIERAEAVLRAHGFRQFRVRHHDSLARIEVAQDEIERAFAMREVIGRDVQATGYKFVAIDAFGYRSGAMNVLLEQPGG